jgi:hypothetical protein
MSRTTTEDILRPRAACIIRDYTSRPTAIAEAAGVLRQIVYRVQDDLRRAEAMLVEWGI